MKRDAVYKFPWGEIHFCDDCPFCAYSDNYPAWCSLDEDCRNLTKENVIDSKPLWCILIKDGE